MADETDPFWAAYDARLAARRRDPLLTLADGQDAIRTALCRPARPFQVGGFRPTGAPDASCFGEVRLRAASEAWPVHGDAPMFPLLQLNVAAAGVQSGPLSDVTLMTVFLSPNFQSAHHTLSAPEGEAGFAVRTYESLSGLVPVDPPTFETTVKPFECIMLDLVDDYHDHVLASDHVDTETVDVYAFDWHQTSAATKLGGWPATIQSEPWWMYRPDAPEVDYVFQISREDKAHWYCDSMVFARGRDNPSLWAIDVQMY